MNKLDELIEHLCPDGVEFKKLGTIGKVCMCKRVMKHETNIVGEIPFYKIGTFGKEADAYVSKELFEDYKKSFSFPKVGDILISASGTIGRTVVYDGKPAYFQDSNIVWIDNNENKVKNKFLFYYYKIVEWKTDGGTISRLYNDNLAKTTIPIPPLPIQQEIVNILDKFTKLEAELNAELEARREQYEYYRNELLNFEGKEVEWKSLGEITNYSKSRIAAYELDSKTYVGVDNLLQNKQGKTSSNYVPKTGGFTKYEIGDILIGNIRPYLKKVWRATNKGGTNGDVLVIRIYEEAKEKLNSEFLYYLLSSDVFFEYEMQFAKGAKMPRGDKSSIMKFKIPIPPIAEQERIVGILDKFDKLVNDISEGLPAEIQARHKQYEYYRNELLNFKPLAQ